MPASSASRSGTAPAAGAPAPALRIDRWLWAARFFKTRSTAAAAVSGGKVHLNGQRAKPAKGVRPGDRLQIRRGDVRWEVTVLTAAAARRGPAAEARTLYEERPESVERREREREERRARRLARGAAGPGRPTKRARRRLELERTPRADPGGDLR